MKYIEVTKIADNATLGLEKHVPHMAQFGVRVISRLGGVGYNTEELIMAHCGILNAQY